MGKGMPPMPGKGMPPMMPGKGMPPFGKGMPPMPGKGMPMLKGKPGFKGMPPPGMMGVHREALDTQRFAVERKRKFRNLVSGLHKLLSKEDHGGVNEEKNGSTDEFTSKLNLKLEK